MSKLGAEYVVAGPGLAALATVGFLAASGKEVVWVSGTAPRIHPVVPGFESGDASQVWIDLLKLLGCDEGVAESLEKGKFLREFRNKSFRAVSWEKEQDPEVRRGVRDEMLWDPERSFAALNEATFATDWMTFEKMTLDRIKGLSNVRIITGSKILGVKIEEGRLTSVRLDSGVEITCSNLVFGDSWSGLAAIEGLPKPLPFTRKRIPHSVVQATLKHKAPIAMDSRLGFFGTLNKEAGEDFERRVWGYFSQDGLESCWTICLSETETEDNHEIVKKYRKMKNLLDKMFSFLESVDSEQVRFAEDWVFGSGDAPREPFRVPEIKGVSFITDGCGLTSSFQQVRELITQELGLTLERAQDDAILVPAQPMQIDAATYSACSATGDC
ncbi:hypothetical protein WDW86_01855 [Bdellovibrionota bacterium FG-2]